MQMLLRLGEQILQVRLIDRHLARAEALDLGGVDIDARHVVTEECQARAGRQPDVPSTDNADLHDVWPSARRLDQSRARRPYQKDGRRLYVSTKVAPRRRLEPYAVHPDG